LLAKTSIGRITIMGISVITAGCLGLVLFNDHTTVPWMMVVTAIIGFGFGLSLTAFTVAVQSSVEWKVRGAAMGTFNLMRNLGQSIGIAVSGLWLSDQLRGYVLETSLHTVFLILVILAVCAIVTAGMLLGEKGKQLSMN
jgi:MFS family permease